MKILPGWLRRKTKADAQRMLEGMARKAAEALQNAVDQQLSAMQEQNILQPNQNFNVTLELKLKDVPVLMADGTLSERVEPRMAGLTCRFHLTSAQPQDSVRESAAALDTYLATVGMPFSHEAKTGWEKTPLAEKTPAMQDTVSLTYERSQVLTAKITVPHTIPRKKVTYEAGYPLSSQLGASKQLTEFISDHAESIARQLVMEYGIHNGHSGIAETDAPTSRVRDPRIITSEQTLSGPGQAGLSGSTPGQDAGPQR